MNNNRCHIISVTVYLIYTRNCVKFLIRQKLCLDFGDELRYFLLLLFFKNKGASIWRLNILTYCSQNDKNQNTTIN